ncbi:hypothetical protein N7522_001218 [Penicillium canescens]|nr:hypothetical protein N7522_001218 [Penicillium canescens]
MDFSALHQLQTPGIIKASKRQGRRPGKSACAACHARKKRCDISPPYYQCTHCRKEGQICISRDPIERRTRHRIPTRNRNHNLTANSDNDNDNDAVSDDDYNGNILPFPKGIDHEIPRWSAAFSMFSEVRRLLAPPSPESEEDCAEEESGDLQDIAVADERVGEDERDYSGIERNQNASLELGSGDSSRRDISDDTSADEVCIKGNSIPTSQSASQSPSSEGRTDSGSVLAACRTGIVHENLSSMGEVRVRGGHDLDERVFMDDLDALLRF